MKLTVVGCGDAFGSGGRLQTCYHVETAATRFLIDCGATALIGFNRSRHRSQRRRDHLHLAPARRPLCRPGVVADPCPARGQAHRAPDRRRPAGRARRASRRRRKRCFRAPAGVARRYELRFLELAREKPLDVGSVRVTPFEVVHPSGAPPYALRFEVEGKVLSFTGDTRMDGEPGARRPGRRPLHHGVLPVRRRAALPHELADDRSATSTASPPSASCSRTWPSRCWRGAREVTDPRVVLAEDGLVLEV